MVLLSMTYKEIYDNLKKDKRKVDIRKERLLPKAIKYLKQRRVFPAWVWYEYKIPSTNNQYVIFFYAANSKCATQPESDAFCFLFEGNQRFVIKWGVGTYNPKGMGLTAIRTLNIYTSHFIQRYNERCIKNESLTPNDVMCRYLSRNPIVTPIRVDEDINRKWKEYGEENGIGFHVNDGICFVSSTTELETDEEDTDNKPIAMMYYYKTYVSKNEMNKEQWDVISKRYVDMWKKSMADYYAQAVDGKITLRLES